MCVTVHYCLTSCLSNVVADIKSSNRSIGVEYGLPSLLQKLMYCIPFRLV